VEDRNLNHRPTSTILLQKKEERDTVFAEVEEHGQAHIINNAELGVVGEDRVPELEDVRNMELAAKEQPNPAEPVELGFNPQAGEVIVEHRVI